MLAKRIYVRNEKHRRWIASLPCCISGAVGQTQCAHIRDGVNAMGKKPSDSMCVPLSILAHSLQHTLGELKFWEGHGGIEKAKELANALFVKSGDDDYAHMLIARFRRQ